MHFQNSIATVAAGEKSDADIVLQRLADYAEIALRCGNKNALVSYSHGISLD